MLVEGILIHEKDQVITVTGTVGPGDTIRYKTREGVIELPVKEFIPCYHKAARAALPVGKEIYKYGESIGVAVKEIFPGCLVHTDNLSSKDKGEEGI